MSLSPSTKFANAPVPLFVTIIFFVFSSPSISLRFSSRNCPLSTYASIPVLSRTALMADTAAASVLVPDNPESFVKLTFCPLRYNTLGSFVVTTLFTSREVL